MCPERDNNSHKDSAHPSAVDMSAHSPYVQPNKNFTRCTHLKVRMEHEKVKKKWNRIVRCFGSKFIFTIPVPIYKDAIHPSTRSQTADHTKCLHLRDSSYQLLGTNRGHLQVKLTMGSLDASYSQLLSAEFRLYKECQAGCSCVSRQYLFA